uniref:Uncharacterized protein n=1 Tax=Serinus canaria TaxID=9135 RepID=A0A8C9NP88_SERCA
MTEVEPVLDFASSGRTGRRNALPDILGSPAGVSPADLPLKLAEMTLNTSSGYFWVSAVSHRGQRQGEGVPGPSRPWCL